MTVKATVTSTLNTQGVDFTLVEEGPRGHHAYETETLSGGTETFIFTGLDGGRDKTYYPKVSPETTDVTQTATVPYGFDVDIDPLPHRDSDAAGHLRDDVAFSQGVGARQLGLGENALTNGLLTAALNDGEVLADDGYVYSSVQSALDASSSWAFVGPGTFNEAVTISTQGLTLRGSGESTLIDGGTISNAIDVQAADVTIADLAVRTTGGAANNYSGIVHGVGASGVTVIRVTVEDSDDNGISLVNDVNCSIINCHVKSTDEWGARTDARGKIIGVRTDSAVDSDGVGSAIETFGDDSIIADCTVLNPGNRGIALNSNDTIAISSRVVGAGSNGIVVQSGFVDCIVANNRVSDSTTSDISDGGTGTVLDANVTGVSN